MSSKNERPMWLTKDGQRHLYAAADVADAKANGWEEPEDVRGNGEPWNPAPKEDERSQLDALESVNAERAKRDEKRAKARESDSGEVKAKAKK